MRKKIYCFIIALALGLSGCGSVVTETKSTHTEDETKSIEENIMIQLFRFMCLMHQMSC
jgi:uncharacterized protein YceK